jgi:nucleotidyltransferase/DNA polymerase involved in DNA repair
MTFVALSIADWPTGAAANDLLAQLLAIAPRAAVSPGERLAWLDARGLDPGALTAHACEALGAIGITRISAGVAQMPIVAMVAAARVMGRASWDAPCTAVISAASGASHDPRPTTSSLTHISPGTERAYLAPLPLDVLAPASQLMSLFAGVGLETCGDLARLSRESVEVRFGREGLAAWRLARADDRRPIFSSRPRELPNASLDWTEFSTTDLEQLVFVLHSLLKTVCDTLAGNGTGARSLTLTLALENRATIVQPVGAARSTAQRTTWLRLMRRALERITLPDRVTGIAVQVDAVGAPEVRQGDLFDLGFASAHAAESAVAHVMDLQSDAVVAAERNEHYLPERRVRWKAVELAAESGGSADVAKATSDLHGANVTLVTSAEPRLQPRAPLSPTLHPMLLPAPREITVLAQSRRGFATPFRYIDNGVAVSLKECVGPHCISGEHWSDSFAREYHQGVRADGVVVLLYRDVPSDTWYLAGWWD